MGGIVVEVGDASRDEFAAVLKQHRVPAIEIGRTVAPVPALPTLVLGGLPIAQFGTGEQKTEWLVPMAEGKVILTAALLDAGSSDAGAPATKATPDGSGWKIDGEKSLVPAAHLVRRILVPAVTPDGVGIFLEPLGHNPAINLVRRLTPHLRTPDERPLRMSDLQTLRRYFTNVETRFVNLSTLFSVPFAYAPGGSLLRRSLGIADRGLFETLLDLPHLVGAVGGFRRLPYQLRKLL